ncbi:MAG: hypothetical protein U5J63_13065 [Fodinibius sp.]|nr:hypothetical protein [Fodinibius sp.]
MGLSHKMQSARFTDVYPNREFGDMDGDGVDDYVLGYSNSNTDELGRAFIYGNASGNPTTDQTTVSANQFSAGMGGIVNVGDV